MSDNGQTPSIQNHRYSATNIGEEETQQIRIETPCDCSYLIAVEAASSESVFSITAKSDGGDDGDGHHAVETHSAWFYVLGVVIFIVIVVLSAVGLSNYKKNEALKRELDVAELQLNMKGKSMRKEMASTTSGPPKPWKKAIKMKKKRKGSKKYVGLSDNDMLDDGDEPILVHQQQPTEEEHADDTHLDLDVDVEENRIE